MRFRTSRNYTKRQMNQDHFDSVRLYHATQTPGTAVPSLNEQEAEAVALADLDADPEGL